MSLSQHYIMFARYNAWANGRIYDAAAALRDEDYRADRGAFFGSVHRTLNHLLVTDRIWMVRLAQQGTAPDRLDAILHERLNELRTAREAEDRRITAWIESLAEADLGAIVQYRPVSNPKPVAQSLSSALAHLFNHQTHHRGQIHGLLTAIAGKGAAPSLDLILFQREQGIG
ncbi:damage-inducible protein DinB [Agaricicola taiwanensis]|uniref:Damage-inducible protein DinB n=1 Tax=Agaricicola taiwanensis TaxID=591372 RepID=A0A8J2YHP1_9RHOB|nr:DinB family protein [Agaricicola taiwanensis]GGE43122.1 damage-inducible protein DinB [Agaricicola taiwanensis]